MNENINERHFPQRLDYYWKSLSLYSIILSIFLLIKESISNNKIITAVYHPVIIILILFVIITLFALVVQIRQKKVIFLSDEGITLSTRNKSKSYKWEEIQKIYLIKTQLKKEQAIRLIKLKFYGRRRGLRLNPSMFQSESELVEFFTDIKTKLKK